MAKGFKVLPCGNMCPYFVLQETVVVLLYLTACNKYIRNLVMKNMTIFPSGPETHTAVVEHVSVLLTFFIVPIRRVPLHPTATKTLSQTPAAAETTEEKKPETATEAAAEATTEAAADAAPAPAPEEATPAPAAEEAAPAATRAADEVSGGTEEPDAKKAKVNRTTRCCLLVFPFE